MKEESTQNITVTGETPTSGGEITVKVRERMVAVSVDDGDSAGAVSERIVAQLAKDPCDRMTPRWFTGHWRDWHRGHGCDKDDGKPRSMGAALEIAANGGGR